MICRAVSNESLLVACDPDRDRRGCRGAAVAGTAVFSDMLGVTAVGLLFAPAFYTVVRTYGRRIARGAAAIHAN
jgi:hypothetical protein